MQNSFSGFYSLEEKLSKKFLIRNNSFFRFFSRSVLNLCFFVLFTSLFYHLKTVFSVNTLSDCQEVSTLYYHSRLTQAFKFRINYVELLLFFSGEGKVEHYRVINRQNRVTVDEESYFSNLIELVKVSWPRNLEND